MPDHAAPGGAAHESFKHALRAALREDPDIVLVGEMRDLETISIAIETAETGHLVFGTLHTTTAPSTIDRIIDQFPADRQAQIRVMLSESLKGVIAQTLCRRSAAVASPRCEILLVNARDPNLIREGEDLPDSVRHADVTKARHGDAERLAGRTGGDGQVEPRRRTPKRSTSR